MPTQHQPVEIRFAVAGRAGRVGAAHPVWTEALPLSIRRVPAGSAPTAALTHRAYFEAIQIYFQSEGARHLETALKAASPEANPCPVPERIDVVLEKHGEFYHPARIRVAGLEGAHDFVLNVAATPAGFECMDNEIELLDQVAPRLPEGALPRIYGAEYIEIPGGPCFGMFLADWFVNYHEFHLSIDPRDGAQKVIIWDNHREPSFLPRKFIKDVYYQAAYLLTRAYDPGTTRQIYPWHHASGDFVLRHGTDGLRLKLISVRQYAPTLEVEDGRRLDAETRMMAAMVFFSNLTLRNRIDRLDGTGEMAWAEDAAVGATVAGFKQAMNASSLAQLTPLLLSYDEDDWVALLQTVGVRYRLMPAEDTLLERHLGAHAACLRRAIRDEFPK